MEKRSVDVAVIGAGTAGLNARRTAEKAGASTLLVERGPHGTTCARVGCMPSKLLIAAAEVAHEAAGARRFGVDVSDVRVDGPAVLDRVRRERDRFVGFVLDSVDDLAPEKRLDGTARFVGPTTLEVDGRTRVEARAVVIATGTSPRIPQVLDPIREHALTTDELFELPDLPESVAVVGSGVIALELGQALHRLGTRVAIFGRSEQVGPLTDPHVHASAVRVLGEVLAIHRGARIVEASGDPERGFRVRWRTREGGSGDATFQHVLAAAGRTPNLAGLDLERAGLRLDAHGRLAHDPGSLQVGDAPVFLAGDVTGERAILHEAADEGRIAGANAARFPEVLAPARRTPLVIAFTHPQIALAGARFADLDPEAVAVGSVDYGDQGRARVMGMNAGVVRAYARRRCGTLLGAEMFGPRVEHTAHLLAWAIQARLTVEQALANPFYHPVVEEGIQTALRDLSSRLRRCSVRRPQDLESGPGS